MLPEYNPPPTTCTILGEPWTLPPSTPGGKSSRGSHRLGTAMACETRCALSTFRGLERADADPYIASGTAVHLALAYLYGPQCEAPPDWLILDAYDVTLANALEGCSPKVREVCAAIAASARRAWEARVAKHGDIVKGVLSVESEQYITLGEVLGPRCPEIFRSEVISARTDLAGLSASGGVLPLDWKLTWVDGRTKRLPRWNPKNHEWVMGAQAAVNRLVLRTRYPAAVVHDFTVVRISRDSPHDFSIDPIRLASDYEEQLPQLLLEAVEREFRVRDKLEARTPVMRDGALRGACKPGPKKRPCDFLEICDSTPGPVRTGIVQLTYRKKSA